RGRAAGLSELHKRKFSQRAESLGVHGRPRELQARAEARSSAVGPLPRLRRRLLEAGARGHRDGKPRLPGLRLPRLADHLVGYRTCAAAPHRRGSPAASLGVTRLTPPKKWCCASQTRTSKPFRSRAPTVAFEKPGSSCTRPPAVCKGRAAT